MDVQNKCVCVAYVHVYVTMCLKVYYAHQDCIYLMKKYIKN